MLVEVYGIVGKHPCVNMNNSNFRYNLFKYIHCFFYVNLFPVGKGLSFKKIITTQSTK